MDNLNHFLSKSKLFLNETFFSFLPYFYKNKEIK